MLKCGPILGIGYAATLLMLATGCSTPPKFPVAQIARTAAFEPIKPEAKLPGAGLILVPQEVLQAMPALDGGNDNVWLWFYRTGLGTAFDKAEVIQQLPRDSSGSHGKVVVKPELWGYFFQRYRTQWTCWLEFKIRFLNAEGKETAAFLAEGNGSDAEAIPALGSALHEVVRKYRRTIANTKRRELSGQ